MTQHVILNPDTAKRVREIHHRGKRGRLLVASSDALREIFFDSGEIVGVRTTRNEERLGELLIRIGRITRQHFEDASIFVRHGWRLGEVLAELEIIDRGEIDAFVRQQAMEVSCRALAEARAKAEFDESAELFTTLAVPLSATAVVIKASRRVDSLELLRRVLAAETRMLRPAPLSEISRCTELTPEEGYLISRFQDGATLTAVLNASDLEERQMLGSLFGLLQSGLLVPENDVPSEQATLERAAFRKDVDRMFRRLERHDPWRALDLPRDVGIETAREAFREAMCRYHPDRHYSQSDEELRRKLSRVCQSFTDAYTCLSTALRLRRAKSDESAIPLASTAVPRSGPPTQTQTTAEVDAPAAPATPTPTPTPTPTAQATATTTTTTSTTPERRGEALFESATCHEECVSSSGHETHTTERPGHTYVREGRRAFAEADYWRAIELLRQALSLGEDLFEIHFLLGEALSRNPHWRHDAEQSYRRALEHDPWSRDVYAGLARLYDDAGLTLRASRVREQALEMGLAMEGEPVSDAETETMIVGAGA